MRRPLLVLATCLALVGCQTDYDYLTAVADRPDIHAAASQSCTFDAVDDGWEQYSCSPVFSSNDPQARAWEREGIGGFDIVQREIFGAPFYQMWYSALGGTTANDGDEIGYAVSMDGMTWNRHPWNPVVRRGTHAGSWDRDAADVGCVAFDGDAGVFHLWYLGTNNGGIGTTFGHATSADGVFWDKDLLSPLDPFADTDSELGRVWGCDALYEDGQFHFWAGGVNFDHGVDSTADFFASARYDIAWLTTTDGANFDGGDLVLEHAGFGSGLFDAEGVHQPSVFTWDEPDGEEPRYWMLYAGYEEVTAGPDPFSSMTVVNAEGLRLGMASSFEPDRDWQRESIAPVPLDFSGVDTADSPRAFLINGRLHVFFVDRFNDPLDGSELTGIGLGISPFPEGVVQ